MRGKHIEQRRQCRIAALPAKRLRHSWIVDIGSNLIPPRYSGPLVVPDCPFPIATATSLFALGTVRAREPREPGESRTHNLNSPVGKPLSYGGDVVRLSEAALRWRDM
jgi:hypothetical protein